MEGFEFLFMQTQGMQMQMKYNDGFSNLHLFKQINIDLIFTDCILYLCCTEDAPFYTRDLRIPRDASYSSIKLLQSWTKGKEEGEEEEERQGSIDSLINETRKIELETEFRVITM